MMTIPDTCRRREGGWFHVVEPWAIRNAMLHADGGSVAALVTANRNVPIYTVLGILNLDVLLWLLVKGAWTHPW